MDTYENIKKIIESSNCQITKKPAHEREIV